MLALASDPGDPRHLQTCPGGAMYRSSLATAIAAIIAVATPPESVTAATYEVPLVSERTSSGPDGHIEPVSPESTGEAVLEIRRRSGLTWEELGELFDVSRRSIHHWASGKPVTSGHERMIRRILAGIRRLDRGDQVATRARLLTVDENLGVSGLELLQQGRFDEAEAGLDGARSPEHLHLPLSRADRDARRPPAPALLLEADQDRPDIPAKARTARAARATRKTG